ncbi:HEAT repeat domain-containing protein [Streptomyces adustus]|uniref:HEAT repeat domain-containing protein n=1 Tax=Streptomyces adustus TaxID=1609272 RepID=UPI0037237202
MRAPSTRLSQQQAAHHEEIARLREALEAALGETLEIRRRLSITTTVSDCRRNSVSSSPTSATVDTVPPTGCCRWSGGSTGRPAWDRCRTRAPGRGQLRRFFAPRFHTDSDFLSWYERWLDFILTGHWNLTWFADQMSGDEAQLVTTLLDDERPTRRRAAACTFITHPAPSTDLPGTLLHALTTEVHPAVRETILRALAAQGQHGRDLLSTALTDPVPGIRSLAAILMTTRTPHGWRLPAHRREILSRYLANETDDSVRDSIQRALNLT